VDEYESQEIIRRIGQQLIANAPESWNVAKLEHRQVGSHSETLISYADRRNKPVAAPDNSLDLDDDLAELRSGHYEPMRGTWLTATLTFSKRGTYDCVFDRAAEPAWTVKPGAEEYRKDLKVFKRIAGFIPTWMERILEVG
jgi:hypothetical protein